MTDLHNDPTIPPTDEPGGEAPPDSILGGLIARRNEIAASVPRLVLDVPGYEGRLVARYKFPEAGARPIIDAVTRAQGSQDPDGSLHGNCDALIATLDTLLGRTEGGMLVDLRTGEPVEIDADVDEPVRFTRDTAAMLQIDVAPEIKGVGRFVARNIFSPRAQAQGVYDGDVALMTQGGRVLTWLQDTTANVGEAFTGE